MWETQIHHQNRGGTCSDWSNNFLKIGHFGTRFRVFATSVPSFSEVQIELVFPGLKLDANPGICLTYLSPCSWGGEAWHKSELRNENQFCERHHG